MSKSTKYGAVGVVIVAVLAFIISGVLASTSISVNSGNNVVLGAGSSYATTCDSDVTVTPLTSLADNGTYVLTTISVTGIAGTSPTCAGKTLNLAFLHSGTFKIASWNIPSDTASNKYDFGGTSGGNSGGTYFATSTFNALSASGLTSIAVSIN